MRELEFRAWSEETKSMYFMDELAKKQLGDLLTSDLIVEQYSGLKDKNGQKVFEGDIVQYQSYWGKIGQVVYHPKFGYSIQYITKENRATAMRQEYFSDVQSEMEIVGNIHENVELLETGETV